MMKQLISGKPLLLFLFLLLAPALSRPLATPAGEASGNAPYALADSPLQVRSWEKDGLLVAEISGLIDYPFSRVEGALTLPESWCEFTPLVFNIKSCTFEERQGRTLLTLHVGRKFHDPLAKAFRLQYIFRVRERKPDRFQVDLVAAEGPQGTRDYRIELEGSSTADGRTAIRLHSSFRPSLRSNLATSAYLSTSGQDKVGFTILGEDDEGPVYVGGTRGIIERNAMRYYLALKAFFDTLHLPEERRFEARLQAWYAMTEQYRRQLYEMERDEYLEAKRKELKRQQALQRQLGSAGGGRTR